MCVCVCVFFFFFFLRICVFGRKDKISKNVQEKSKNIEKWSPPLV